MVTLNSSSLLGELGSGERSHSINIFAEAHESPFFDEIRAAASNNIRISSGNRDSLSVDDFEFGLGLSHTMLSGMQLEGEFRRFGKSVGAALNP